VRVDSFKRVAIVGGLFYALIMSGCATVGRSVGLGAAVGAGTGMAIGAIADPGQKGEYRTRNVIIGGTLGAMTGMVASSMIHSSAEKNKANAFKAGQAAAVPIDPNEQPKLVPAQWRAEVVEAKRIGNRFVPRHVEYVITDPARWEDAQ
jgi:hypothetical protein